MVCFTFDRLQNDWSDFINRRLKGVLLCLPLTVIIVASVVEHRTAPDQEHKYIKTSSVVTRQEITAEPTKEPTKQPKKNAKENKLVDCPWSAKTQKRVKSICERRGVSFYLVMSMAYTESRYNGKAIGDYGQAYGAWQIHPNEWLEELARFGYEPKDMLDIRKQAHILAYLMQAHIDRFDGDERAALMAWNGGGDYATRMMASGKISSYAKEILKRKERLACGEN